jgi:FKBP-type peptidyl-prolyl cis-trans isomerase SlyD
MTTLIGNNCVVSIHYTLTDDQGNTLDSSKNSGPLDYLHGANNLIPGLERELTGRSAGDSFNVTIAPDHAYGLYRDELVQIVPIAMFEDVEDIEPGMQFETHGPNGHELVTVIRIEDGNVTIDSNHPLAGKTLHFDVSVESVRYATPEEREHGHVHHEHSHHH